LITISGKSGELSARWGNAEFSSLYGREEGWSMLVKAGDLGRRLLKLE
jgi:hypothetical protein